MNLSRFLKIVAVPFASFARINGQGTISGYQYIGPGRCTGGGSLYAGCSIDNLGSYSTSAEDCANHCSTLIDSSYIGFSAYAGQYSTGCQCWFNNGNEPSGAGCSNNGGASGEIDGVSPSAPYAPGCYAYESFDPNAGATEEALITKLSNAEITLDQCNAFAVSDGSELLKCAASVDIPLLDGQLKVVLQEGACRDGEPDTSNGAAGVDSNEQVEDSLDVNVAASEISSATLAGDGTKSIEKQHCFRADFYPTEGGGATSALARKWDVTSAFIYDTSGTFQVDVSTQIFSANDASATANRADSLDAYQCNENGGRDDTALTIGQILYTCIESNDADVSVDITQLSILKKDDSPYDPAVTPIDNSVNSFVTEKNCAASPSNGGKNKCIVSTLMIPLLYDGQTDSSIKVSGTASLTYSRRRLHANADRALQDGEESSFEFVVPLSKNALPEVTNPYIDIEDSSSSITSAFGLVFAMLDAIMVYSRL